MLTASSLTWCQLFACIEAGDGYRSYCDVIVGHQITSQTKLLLDLPQVNLSFIVRLVISLERNERVIFEQRSRERERRNQQARKELLERPFRKSKLLIENVIFFRCHVNPQAVPIVISHGRYSLKEQESIQRKSGLGW